MLEHRFFNKLLKKQLAESSGDNLLLIMIMTGSFLPSLWSSNNQSLLGLRDPTLL